MDGWTKGRSDSRALVPSCFLSLSLTHKHTHKHILTFSPSFSQFLSFIILLIVVEYPHTHTQTHAHARRCKTIHSSGCSRPDTVLVSRTIFVIRRGLKFVVSRFLFAISNPFCHVIVDSIVIVDRSRRLSAIIFER